MTRRPLRMAAAVCGALLPSGALAHAGHVHWTEVGTTWTWDPWVVLPLGLSALLYTFGVARLWLRAGAGRGVQVWQVACFAAGWLLLAGALVAPLHWLGVRLFTAHMVEHEILMVLAAPLLAVARPIGAILWALPASWRRGSGRLAQTGPVRRAWRRLTSPMVATILHGLALWVWHVPALYEAALASPRVHWLQHVCFFVSALLFWWSLLRGPLRRRGYGAAVLYLFATALHSGFLGILIALARRPIYPMQTQAAPEWGFTPMEDQQLAGLVMWVPAGLVYAAAALAFAAVWISATGARTRPGMPARTPT